MITEKRKRGRDEAAGENETKQTALSHEAYTVGWVCALPKEQTAAIAMLDQRHPNIPSMQPPTDTNAYTLGSISGHNIVIACLPKGQIGVVPAATVATNMVSTFPSIKIGLMVGIGGGVPSNKVRLGDVVVSTPTGPHPGVVQWDFGKAKDGGNFERTGSLNNPPTVLLAALTKLETSHEIKGPKMDEYLEELGRNYPRLASKYLRSEALRDILFEADCAHVDADDISSDEDDGPDACRNCDRAKAKEKKLRGTRIHYGLVASGNQVIKDGIFRDKLNKDLGGQVLCVEMEAAGLMKNFPCIVVRGICDYADSHKNKEWQEHAAAVAAACAKELLAQIEPQAIQAERSAQETLKNIQDTVLSTASNVDSMNSHLLREEDLKILDWLSPVDYGKRQSQLFSMHEPGTGTWFLNSENFQLWLKSSGKTLFCSGIPGAGKTIMASTVIHHLSEQFLQHETSVVAYIFCDYTTTHEQSLDDLLATLLQQICRQSRVIPGNIRQLHQEHTRRQTRPSSANWKQALISTAKSLTRVIFVIDALDEYQSQNHHISDLASCLTAVQAEASINVMYTSRSIPNIVEQFRNCLLQPIEAKKDDVEALIRSHLSKAPHYIREAHGLINTITSVIPKLVNGMFLLAKLYLDALKDTTSAREGRKTLSELQDRNHSLSTDSDHRNALYRAYAMAVERITKQPRNFQALGMKTIMWVLFAVRPLSPKELQHALAINEGDSELDDESLRDVKTILSACAGLLLIDEQSDTVRPAHFTTQEYFMANKSKYFANAQSEITRACVTFLRFGRLWNHMSGHIWNQQGYIWNGTGSNWEGCSDLLCQLSVYVTANWGHHAREAFKSHEPSTSKILPIVVGLLTDENLAGYIWAYVDTYKLPGSVHIVRPGFHVGAVGLHVAAHFDLVEAATDLIKLGANADGSPERKQTPLMVASKLGNERFVTFLLENGAKVHKLDPWQRSAAFYAWDSSHHKIMTELLDHADSIGEPCQEIHQQWSNDRPMMNIQFGQVLLLYRSRKARLQAAVKEQNKQTKKDS